MKETKICGIGAMKGGVGKSTITSLIANYIHNETDFSVCVIDADDLQQTLNTWRQNDIDSGINKNLLYDLISINSSDLQNVINNLIGNFDYIFIDLPGNLLQEGVIQTYSIVEYLFIPTALSSADLSALINFVDIYNDNILKLRQESGLKSNVFCFLNRIKKNVKEFKEFTDLKNNFPFNFLDNYIPESFTSFQRNVNTYKVYKNYKGENEYDNFCEELIKSTL